MKKQEVVEKIAEKVPEPVKPVSPPPKPNEVVTIDRGKISPDGVATV